MKQREASSQSNWDDYTNVDYTIQTLGAGVKEILYVLCSGCVQGGSCLKYTGVSNFFFFFWYPGSLTLSLPFQHLIDFYFGG